MTPIEEYYKFFVSIGKDLDDLDEELALYMKYGYMIATKDDMILAHHADSTKIDEHQHIRNTIGQETDSYYINWLHGSMDSMKVFWLGIPHEPKEYVFFHRMKKGEPKLSRFNYYDIRKRVTETHKP